MLYCWLGILPHFIVDITLTIQVRYGILSYYPFQISMYVLDFNKVMQYLFKNPIDSTTI